MDDGKRRYGMRNEHEVMKNVIDIAVKEGLQQKKNPDELADFIKTQVMEEIYEDFRSITEIYAIVDAVRCGMRVQVDYYNEEDEENECVVRQEW